MDGQPRTRGEGKQASIAVRRSLQNLAEVPSDFYGRIRGAKRVLIETLDQACASEVTYNDLGIFNPFGLTSKEGRKKLNARSQDIQRALEATSLVTDKALEVINQTGHVLRDHYIGSQLRGHL